MNKSRRKIVESSIASLKESYKKLEAIHAAENEYLGRIPENDENEDKIEAISELVEHLDDAISSLRDAIDTLEGGDF